MVRRMLDKLSAWMRRFMAGRYGTDQLNMAILGAGLVLCIISMFIRIAQLNLLMTTIA